MGRLGRARWRGELYGAADGVANMIDKTLWTNADFARRCMEADERLKSAPAHVDRCGHCHDGCLPRERGSRRGARVTPPSQAVRATAVPPATTTPTSDRLRKDESLDAWAKRCPMAPVPLALFAALFPVLRELKARVEGTPIGAPAARTAPKPRVRLRGMWDSPSADVHP